MTRISRGIGISMNIANLYLHLYYNMLVGYAIYFMVSSFTTELPWQKCNPLWASPNCVDDFSPEVFNYNPCTDSELYYKCDVKDTFNFGKCFNLTHTLDLQDICNQHNETILEKVGYWKTQFPSYDYWNKVILQKTPSIDEPGNFVWQLVLSLFVAHLIIYLMLVRGLEVAGKLVWFTAIFPYFVLLVLGVRGWMLPGAIVGIKYYIIPDWSKLLEFQIWSDAAVQIFFSLTLSYGGLTMLASFNKFDSNIQRTAIIVPVVNCLTSFFAGFVIFAYMGYLSHITGQDIDNIIEAGQGLAFVVYPFAVTTIAGAPLWSILFFFMLILLGVDSTISNLNLSYSSAISLFPRLGKTARSKNLTLTTIFLVYFVGGLVFTLQSGTYWLEIFNAHGGDWALILLGVIQCFVVVYLYGLKNIKNDIEAMLGPAFTTNRVFSFWAVMWSFVTPVICIAILISIFATADNIQIGDYRFPNWTQWVGQGMTISIFLGVFSWVVYALIDARFFNKRPIRSLFQPDFEEFMPLLEENKRKVRLIRGMDEPNKFGYSFENETFENFAERF